MANVLVCDEYELTRSIAEKDIGDLMESTRKYSKLKMRIKYSKDIGYKMMILVKFGPTLTNLEFEITTLGEGPWKFKNLDISLPKLKCLALSAESIVGTGIELVTAAVNAEKFDFGFFGKESKEFIDGINNMG